MITTRTVTKLESKIFDTVIREQTMTTFVSQEIRDHKVLTQRQQIESQASGQLYPRRRGPGFRRFHRASAPGQRPAPDTLTLVNAISDQMTSDMTGEVYIAPNVNPENKQTADVYGAILQERLGRPISDDGDAATAQQKMLRDANVMLLKLL
jgi:hypothetical protein